MKKYLLLFILLFLLIFSVGCKSANESYITITTAEAVQMMEEKDGYIILDVRTYEEYDEGHIPNAINIPVDSINEDNIKALNDKDQLILVYCRSGNRSKTASKKLVELGYKNVVDFGGIISWTGEIEK